MAPGGVALGRPDHPDIDGGDKLRMAHRRQGSLADPGDRGRSDGGDDGGADPAAEPADPPDREDPALGIRAARHR